MTDPSSASQATPVSHLGDNLKRLALEGAAREDAFFKAVFALEPSLFFFESWKTAWQMAQEKVQP